MKYEWYLFDLDGTLTESGDGIINSAKDALTRMGAEVPSDEAMRAFIGPPLLWSFQNVAHLSEADAQKAIALYRERYSDVGWMENRVYPGIAPLLRGIKRRGGKIALASAKPELFCRKILDYFDLAPYFDRVSAITFSDHSAEKKDIILRALPLEEERKNAVMIGDRKYDIEGAKQAGVTSVGVEYGYGLAEEFAEADAVAKTVDDLWDVLVGEARDPGYFITFEGVDGCGKSTQFHRAAEYLSRRGWDVVTSREPGGCPISERIRDLLLDLSSVGMTAECEAILYAASRTQHVHDVILPAVRAGKMMLCDRFLDSSIAYQAYGRELTEPFIRQINKPAVGDLVPDLTLLYAADTATARARVAQGGTPDRLESEGDDFVSRVSAGYARLAEREPERIRVISAMRSIDEVFADTTRHLTNLLR